MNLKKLLILSTFAAFLAPSFSFCDDTAVGQEKTEEIKTDIDQSNVEVPVSEKSESTKSE